MGCEEPSLLGRPFRLKIEIKFKEGLDKLVHDNKQLLFYLCQ